MLDSEAQVLSIDELIDTTRRNVYRRYRTHADVEDIVQEAAVYAWKKHEAGGTDLECYLAGKNRARSLVYALKIGEGAGFTGKPANLAARRKQSNGDAVREKIRMYIHEFTRLHGKEPNNSEISRGVGTSHSNVRHHRKQLHLFDGAPDARPYYISMDEILDNETDTQAYWLSRLPTAESSESATLTKVAVRKAMEKLSQKERKLLYLEFWQDSTYVAIGKELGCHGNYVNHMRKRIMAKLGQALEGTE